ncbi:hypothetical protein L210DRAFT_3078967 [Boletus edulis BED1]|uniref:Uncharacterized protein n=1 Tax=Boletus edulis BED1 TaxID=1328754 RepID=A0AAD4BHM3_BOLED|nr:hypothetical protein L210DRAFT_3078967 [Boletus edulis BED1]
MDPRSIARVTRKVSDEMDDIKDILRVKITDITPDLLANWDITSTIGKVILERAPVLTQVLHSAAQTERGSRENTTKDRTTPCQVLMTQLPKLDPTAVSILLLPLLFFYGRMALRDRPSKPSRDVAFVFYSHRRAVRTAKLAGVPVCR